MTIVDPSLPYDARPSDGDETQISRRMMRLARFLERLPAGKRYFIMIEKPTSPTEKMLWEVSEANIVRSSDG